MDLYLFNIKTDKNDPVLAANCDFIGEISKFFGHVFVFSTHIGAHEFSGNVSVHEIGGGSKFSKAAGFVRILRFIFLLVQNTNSKKILIHMNDKVALIICPLMSLLRIPTNLWYSHASASKSLKIANKFVTRVFTTSRYAYPLSHGDIHPVGQLVDSTLFTTDKRKSVPQPVRNRIIHIGRIAETKYLFELVDAVANLSKNLEIELGFVGGAQGNKESEYKMQLEMQVIKSGVNATWYGPRSRGTLPLILKDFFLVYSGTKKAIDKSAVEAAMGGLLVISSNLELLELVGIANYFEVRLGKKFLSVEDQIHCLLIESSNAELVELSNWVSATTIANCDLESRIGKFVAELV